MNSKIVLCGALLLGSIGMVGKNPIVQTHFTPDPAPVVFDDVCYVYTGRDEMNPQFFAMWEWRCYSSTDMVNWTDHGCPLAMEDFSWGDDRAWASQCTEHKGKYYWYICLKDKNAGTMAIGVAVADKPTGPFKDALGKPLATGSWDYIDPTVFTDDDGQTYLYWGNPTLYYVKLNDDMISFEGQVQKVDHTAEAFGSALRTNRGAGANAGPIKDSYTEGPWVSKHAGKYYLSYAAGGIPEHISYSMSDSPIGPWKYVGQIMPNQETNSFTNHSGVVDYKGHSYFFYHTGKLPGGGGYGRSTAVEEFKYNSDGTFPTILMTEEGVSPIGTINPFKRVEAETIAWSEGVSTEENIETGVFVTDISSGDFIQTRVADFGNRNPKTITASVASGARGGQIEVRLDKKDGPVLAVLNVPGTGGWERWTEVKSPVQGTVSGVHDIYLVFKGRKHCNIINIDYWQFN